MPEPRILLIDIETAPSLGHFFNLWKEGNIINVAENWFILSFAYKWLDKKSTHVRALVDFPNYKKNKQCDKELMGDLWELLDKADIVCAHNGDRFDLRRINARFIAHGFIPPDPYKSIDTLKIARKHFKFDSNRLDDLGAYLGVGRKLPNTGTKLWLDCMAGKVSAWTQMKRYNANDVVLLEKVFLKLRPWCTTEHPNLSYYTKRHECPVCQSNRQIPDGFAYLRTGKKQRYRCNSCGHRHVAGAIIKE